MSSEVLLKSIGVIHSPYKEKFSIPRQPGLAFLESTIELLSPYDHSHALMGLEHFSHLWVIFGFHANQPSAKSSLTVRPPRLGGNKKQGVFATRSPFRPNPLGLSLVEIKRIEGHKIIIMAGDLLDGTPVYDLKPYLKEIESRPDARSSWTDSIVDKKLTVVFDCECPHELRLAITEVLSLDPRPRFHLDGQKHYGTRIFDKDVHWKVEEECVRVFEIVS